jgi:hypothetical protein
LQWVVYADHRLQMIAIVHILERKWLVIHQPIIYDRFIDDIFVGVNKKIDYKEFQSHFLNLKFTFNNSKKVNFLDLIIKFDPIIKKLQFSMHIYTLYF